MILNVTAHRLHGPRVTHETTANHDGIITPTILVFHFTAIPLAATVNRFKDTTPGNRVSAHVVIGRDGGIIQFVDFNLRAWHAGRSIWNGLTDINSHSIGIELDNAGAVRKEGDRFVGEQGTIVPADEVIEAAHKHASRLMTHWHRYSAAQIDACHALAAVLVREYHIAHIVGHEDVAPERKHDPGPAFPLASVRDHAFRSTGGQHT